MKQKEITSAHSHLASFRPTSGTPRLSDITKFEANLPIPESGPWAEFVMKASEAGYAADHANALWLFAANHMLAERTTYNMLGSPRRLSPTIVLAGDDISQTTSLRNMIWRVLQITGNEDLLSNLPDALNIARLCNLDTRNILTIVNFDSELPPLKKWKAARKDETSIETILDQDRLNNTLQVLIRSDALAPVAISLFATHPLGSLTSLDTSSNYIFGQALVVPSYGATTCPAPSPVNQNEMKTRLESLSRLRADEDSQLSFSDSAQISWNTILDEHQLEFDQNKSLGGENSSWSRRMGMFLTGLVEVATAHAANRHLKCGTEFAPRLQSDDIDFAKGYMDRLQNAWSVLESIYAQSKDVEIAETYHQRICSDFAQRYTPELNGIVVKLTELVAKYCQHPKRNGHYSSKDFETKILGELRRRNLAEFHPKLPRHWIIFR